MSLPNWLETFKITQEFYQSCEQKASALGCSPLEILLESGKINENKFLIHIQKETKLPYLKAIYFNAQPPTHLWRNVDYKECRKHGTLPIGEWDGHVLWAKLLPEPTAMDNVVPKSIFILAPWSGIQRYFKIWRETFQIEDSAPAPEAIETPEVPPGIAIEVPDGLKFDFSQVTVTKTSSESTGEEAPAAAPEMPEGLAPSKPAVAQAIPKPEEIKIEFELPAIPSTASQTKQPTPPPLPSVSAPPINAAAPATPPMPMASNQDQLEDQLLAEWLKVFDRAMLVLHDNSQISIWRWAGPWEAKFNKGELIPLNTPSIFKIVVDTAQPYHGHVAPSAVNDQYFKLVNGGQYPEHITVTPVVIGENHQVPLILLGITTKLKSKKVDLNHLEQLAKNFAQQLVKLKPQFSKAS